MKMILHNIIRLLLVPICFFAQGSAVHGSSLDFDGAGDYVEFPNGYDLSVFSINMWIKSTGTGQTMVHMDGISGAWIVFETYDPDFPPVGNDITAVNIKNDVGASRVIPTSTVITDNKWHQVTLVLNGTRTKIYVDKIEEADVAYSGDFSCADSPMFFGLWSGVGNYFKGTIDEVQIYSRALELTEIQWLYRHPGATYNTTNLEGWWKLNEFTGVTAGDSSSNTNNGTITDATWNIDTPITVGKSPVTW